MYKPNQQPDLRGFNGYFNTGSTVHKLTSFHRKNDDGSVDVLNNTLCYQVSPGLRGQHLRVTKNEVTCKKCLKAMSEGDA